MPGNGLVVIISVRDLFYPWAVCFDCTVAVHADIKAGKRGVLADFNPRMAIAAVYFVFPCMKLMGKGNRLIRFVAFIIKQTQLVIGQQVNKQRDCNKNT